MTPRGGGKQRGRGVDGREQIDVTYDFRNDTPPGKDTDRCSPTLRKYRRLLWSKPLPCGEVLDLDDTAHGHYLLHRSDELGEFSLSSDSVVPSFRYVPMVREEAEELREFLYIGYTMGGMMLWPGNKVDGKMTINGARGCDPRIKDRFDLTLECVRRYYLDEWNPLRDVFARYADFFELFVDFRGFVEFFLLQDAVTVDCDAVIFSAPFEDFTTSAIPQTMDEYREYRQRAITFIEARNRRILRSFSEDHSSCLKEGAKSVRNAEALKMPHASTRLTPEAVLELAGQCGTRDELKRAMGVAAQEGLRVRAFKTCLMFTPGSNATRCLFTLWAKRDGGELNAFVSTETFTEYFSLERTIVKKRLGPEGWRHFDRPGFEAFLQGVRALALGS